ncbi:MAG: alanine racemase [Hyphomicrobiales bacterium]|nr:alanine racemase [Hyphomicrobiales bacterium]MBV9428308.1 alanine racemase [Bradyrhizobiaceae bacterium]
MAARKQRPAPAQTAPTDLERGGILTIDLAAIVANWRELARRAAPAQCAAVVKADGYGCGIEPVTAALAKAGCATFFVTTLAEARHARAVAPQAAIYVLTMLPGTHAAVAQGNFRPVIGSIEELAEWEAFRASGWQGTAALHIDTGINRLGLSTDDLAQLEPRVLARRAGLDLLMSHFACSEEPSHRLNAKQMADFRELRDLFPGIAGSLANSSGIFLGPDAHHDLVRPGVALYGANPTPGHLNLMRPAVRLEGRIVQVRDVDPGDTVGYGATWTARRPTRLAVVALGYADGFLRAASASDAKPGAEAVVAGRPCPLAGRVSMDLLAVDVTDVPEGKPRRGDTVALLDHTIGVDDLASHAGTIAYEVLTSLGRRYARVYKGG